MQYFFVYHQQVPLGPHTHANPVTQPYLLAQSLGHVVHLLVGFLVHHCCHWLCLLSLHSSALFHRGALRVRFQMGLYLKHILIHI